MTKKYTLVYAHSHIKNGQLKIMKTKKALWQKAKAAESLHHVTNKVTRCRKAEQVLYVKILMLVNIDLFRFNIED